MSVEWTGLQQVPAGKVGIMIAHWLKQFCVQSGISSQIVKTVIGIQQTLLAVKHLRAANYY